MVHQVPAAMAFSAALPDSGILRKSPRFLASILAILARALALRRASISRSSRAASGVSGDFLTTGLALNGGEFGLALRRSLGRKRIGLVDME